MMTKTAAKASLTRRLAEALYGVKPIDNTARNAVLGALAGGTVAAPVGAVRGFLNAPGAGSIGALRRGVVPELVAGAHPRKLSTVELLTLPPRALTAAALAGMEGIYRVGQGVERGGAYGLRGALTGGVLAGGATHLVHRKRMAKYLLRKRVVNAGLGAGGLAAAYAASKRSRK